MSSVNSQNEILVRNNHLYYINEHAEIKIKNTVTKKKHPCSVLNRFLFYISN